MQLKIFHGIGVSPGIAVGKALVVERRRPRVKREPLDPDSVPREVPRLRQALEDSRRQILEIQERIGKELCVRFYQRTDGTIMTEDCPVGVTKRRRKKLALAVAGAGAMALAATSMLLRNDTCRTQGAVAYQPTENDTPVMGEMAAPPVIADPTSPPETVTPPTPHVMGSIAPPTPVKPPTVMGRRAR